MVQQLRGGSDDRHHPHGGAPFLNINHNNPQSSSFSTSTATSSSSSLHSTTDNDETTTTSSLQEQASSLCGDARTRQALRDFGGLRYFNTALDDRFRVLFVLGGPGAGKGTQSELMEEHYPVAHFSVGELLRNVPDDSPHKAVIEQTLVAGQIVPVEISLALLRAAMEEARARVGRQALFLVDGFPRNFDNLSGWCRVMKDAAALEAVLVYQCPLAVLQERILERAKVSGRSDDNLEAVQKRFRTFEEQTMPVVETLRAAAAGCDLQRWNVVDIAGDRSVEDVWVSTQQVLNQLIMHDVLTANAALLDAVQAGNVAAYQELCDKEFFQSRDPGDVMRQQEGAPSDDAPNNTDIQLAQLDVISGKQVAVSYNRCIGGVWVREKRFWSHQGCPGWRNVHFQRTPVPSC